LKANPIESNRKKIRKQKFFKKKTRKHQSRKKKKKHGKTDKPLKPDLISKSRIPLNFLLRFNQKI
jgi:hypothetical protein